MSFVGVGDDKVATTAATTNCDSGGGERTLVDTNGARAALAGRLRKPVLKPHEAGRLLRPAESKRRDLQNRTVARASQWKCSTVYYDF